MHAISAHGSAADATRAASWLALLGSFLTELLLVAAYATMLALTPFAMAIMALRGSIKPRREPATAPLVHTDDTARRL
jgi:hypothetical protein